MAEEDRAARSGLYAPGLDGIRGVAVAAIVAYHLNYIDGGLLSVSVFFTLSGYLITSILLTGWRKTGSIDLKGFWLRRARRLLPALLLLLVAVLLAAAVARPAKLAKYGREAFSAAIYIANWATIARGDTYFNRFTGPGPLDHLWSLAIEEQFYAVWPLLFLGLVVVGRRLSKRREGAGEGRRAPVVAMIITAILAVASALMMAWLYHPNEINHTRAYEGTDARAAPILVGALTAMLWPLAEAGKGGRARRVVLEILGVLSCAVVVWVVLKTDENSPFLYRGGESIVSLASAVLIVAAAHPATFVGKAFALKPLQWFGARTYGVYLWHLPVVAFMPSSLLEGRPIARGLLQLALIVGMAALSWTFLEDPIRRNGVIATFAKRAAISSGRTVGRRWASALVLVAIATFALGTWPLLPRSSASETDMETVMAELEKEAPDPQPRELETVASAAPIVNDAPMITSCTTVIHVGDSTSLGIISKKYIPLAADRLDGRYAAVGVKIFVPEIFGGRAIVEKLNGHPSAYEVISAKKGAGYKGCWVLALGNGDSANIKGDYAGLSQRIDWMMVAAEGTRVLWTTSKTLLDKGPYQNQYIESWNKALVAACAKYPNMRVYDYASEVQDAWYLPDGIHPNDLGAKERASRLALALAVAFPKDGESPKGCLVRSTP